MKRQRTLQSEQRLNNHKLPDSINCSPINNFTQIPNNLLRDPELSFKAKGLICCLLSNQEGWTSHLSQLEKLSDKDGETSIRSGMSELEEAGYLLRMVYRDERKQVVGSFLAYTNSKWEFDLKPRLDKISSMGYSASLQPHTKRRLENLSLANLYLGQLILANPGLKILIGKNTNNKKEQIGGNGVACSQSSPHNDEELPEPVEEQEKKPSHKDNGLVGSSSIEFFPEHLQKDPSFTQSWEEWCQYRRTNPKTPPVEKLTTVGFRKEVARILKELGDKPSILIPAIDNAMARGWRGIYKPTSFDNNGNGNGQQIPKYGPFSTRLTPEEAKAKYGGNRNGDCMIDGDGKGYMWRDGEWRHCINGKEV